ncbi:uncharacterized protein PAC_06333 [Phialocephala subalpina]|uniref:Uncharacterized protein n=1 Tax=Phialocephala subalpina TaxID=576137 RepID=A0A1L7WUI9_9HELO|nr:uncharacterized protein PAC_06333 [Phialocephala subalpina]
MGEIGEWSWVQKEHRKRQKRASNATKPRCRDWILVNGTHHYAKNRNTFDQYRRVESTPTDLGNIIGVGIVFLMVRKSPTQNDTMRVRFDVDVSKDFVRCYRDGESVCYGKTFRGYKRLVLGDGVYGGSTLNDVRKAGKKLELGIILSEDEEKN